MRIFLALVLAATACAAEVRIEGNRLLRDGKPYFILGAGGSRNLEALVQAGGNSIRTWGGAPALDAARERGLTVLVGLDVGKPRQGFDYADAARVARQKESVRQTVLKYRQHPALLMWALGNELELGISQPERLRVWDAVNDLARVVKEADPGHPVIAVLAGAGGGKLNELRERCPALDAVGINAYGGMMSLPEAVAASGWKKPYIVTEFGPRGHWEVAKTPWGLPLEDTSTEKAEFYLKAYRHTVEDSAQCLGSYVFLWGQKQEKTHTWYGMFLPEGNPLGAVDAITEAWTGKPPANRAPRIGAGRIAVEGEPPARYLSAAPGALLRCAVDASDPDGDRLAIRWDLRRDASDNPSRGGDREPAVEPIEGAIDGEGARATVRLPAAPGNYRLFVYVTDTAGAAATANLPLRVR